MSKQKSKKKPVKPFNLAAFKAGEIAIARNGEEVRYLGMVNEDKPDDATMVAVIKDTEGIEMVQYYCPLGHVYTDGGESTVDLVSMKTKTRKVLIQLWRDAETGKIYPLSSDFSEFSQIEDVKDKGFKLLETIEYEVEEV